MTGSFDFKKHTKPLNHYKKIQASSLVQDLLNHPTLTLLYAPSGGQKSLVALDFARSVATGGSFLEKPCEQLKTLYVDGEMSDASISRRAEQFGITDIPLERFGYLTPEREVLDFNDPEVQEYFLEFVEEETYEFVIVDNLRVLLGISDENEATAFHSFNAFIRRLRDRGISVLVIHHSNKSGETYSGSSNLVTVFDYVIGLSGDTSQDYKQVTISKMRDDTELRYLDKQYLSYHPEGFKLNAHAGIDTESVVNSMLEAVQKAEVSGSEGTKIFLRESGLSVDNTGWSYKKLFNDYVQPFADTKFNIQSVNDLKDFCKRKLPAGEAPSKHTACKGLIQ